MIDHVLYFSVFYDCFNRTCTHECISPPSSLKDHHTAFHLLIKQCGLLHFMSSLPGPVHWETGFKKPQEMHWWTLSRHYEKPTQFPCCVTFQQIWTWTRPHGGLLHETMQGINKARRHDQRCLIFHFGTLRPQILTWILVLGCKQLDVCTFFLPIC